MTRELIIACGIAIAMSCIPGCDRSAADGPPEVHLDNSICVECGMILSDERFVAATIVASSRGEEARLFDDYNCQVNYESAHPDLQIIRRWAHDYQGGGWVAGEQAFYLYSAKLRTPMASHAAAFLDEGDAQGAQGTHGGEILTRSALWSVLGQD